jgi:hypothetical protein
LKHDLSGFWQVFIRRLRHSLLLIEEEFRQLIFDVEDV